MSSVSLQHPVGTLTRIDPHDADQVAEAVRISEAARVVDDPDAHPEVAALAARWYEFGWDLDPSERFLYRPDPGLPAVAVLAVGLPHRDNLHLALGGITVHPQHRRQGHGSQLVGELLRRAGEAGRRTVWLDCAEDDPAAVAFLEHHGFRYASHDARRRQVLAEVDRTELDRRYAEATTAAAGYRLERLVAPVAEELLAELVDITAAINDAPMGELTFDDELFDVQRLRDLETARAGRGDTMYRIIARHRGTGEIGGHTMVLTHPLRPALAEQCDTAVAREHRGHRLGLLLKIEMMRWLTEVEPQLLELETWNQADNRPMIDVNEAIGYRLSRVFATYERELG